MKDLYQKLEESEYGVVSDGKGNLYQKLKESEICEFIYDATGELMHINLLNTNPISKLLHGDLAKVKPIIRWSARK